MKRRARVGGRLLAAAGAPSAHPKWTASSAEAEAARERDDYESPDTA